MVLKDTDVRLSVNLTKLNSQVACLTHPTPSPIDTVCSVSPSSRFFITVEVLQCYWQLESVEEDQYLNTFILPYKHIMHCRGSMGFTAMGNEYCLHGDMALQGIENCIKVKDNVLIYDEDLSPHIKRMHQTLTRCCEFGITTNRDKFHVAEPSVRFKGYIISSTGISLDTS